MYELCKRILLAAENETDHAKIAEALDTDVETVAYVLRFYYIEDGELRTKKSPVRQYSPEYQCPSCKKHEGIRLPAEAYIDVVTDASGWPQIDEVEKESQFEVNDQGTASCGSCGHEDSVPAFVYKEPQA